MLFQFMFVYLLCNRKKSDIVRSSMYKYCDYKGYHVYKIYTDENSQICISFAYLIKTFNDIIYHLLKSKKWYFSKDNFR